MNKIIIELVANEEDESPEHSEKWTGSAPGYAKAVRQMMKKSVGKWGWCTAAVTVKVIGERNKILDEETEYLGNCSYLSAVDFVKNSGYFNSMVEEAIERISKIKLSTK